MLSLLYEQKIREVEPAPLLERALLVLMIMSQLCSEAAVTTSLRLCLCLGFQLALLSK